MYAQSHFFASEMHASRGHGEVRRRIPATRNSIAIAISALTMMCHQMTAIATTRSLVYYRMMTVMYMMIEVLMSPIVSNRRKRDSDAHKEVRSNE